MALYCQTDASYLKKKTCKMIEVPEEERQANGIQFSKKEILLLQPRDPDGLLMQ